MNALLGLNGLGNVPLPPAYKGTCAVKSAVPEAAMKPQGKPEDYTLLPEGWRVVISSVLYATCSLATDYAGTVLDECARLKLPLKKQCRTLRSLLDSYLKPRQYVINGEAETTETELGLGIEEACQTHLKAVNVTVRNIAVRKGKPELKDFWSAVAQCMVVTGSMVSYSYMLDGKVRDIFRIPLPSAHMFLPLQMEMLHKYISAFVPGEVWDELTPHIKTAARYMTETLVGCEVYGLQLLRSQRFRKWTPQEERFVLLDIGDRLTDAQKALNIGRSERAFVNKRKELTNKQQTK